MFDEEVNADIMAALDVDPATLKPDELNHMRSYIQETMNELDQQINSIKFQLDGAKANALQEGIYADPDWFRRAQSALRHKGRQRQLIQLKFGDINRRIRFERSHDYRKSQEQLFIAKARELLPPETYQMLWSLVQKEHA